MRALAGIVLALALASPASAATVARTTPEAGPVLAGPEVLWGTEGADGSVRVMAGVPGRPPRLLHRVAAPTGEETTRGVGPLVASPEAYAVRVATSTVEDSGYDWVGLVSEEALFRGPLSGGASLLLGSLPERVEDRPCEGRYEILGGFAVDGARYALGSEHGPCLQTARSQTRLSIAVHDGGTRSRRTLARLGERRDLAGPLDLDATRATWAVDRGARVPGRIVLREL